MRVNGALSGAWWQFVELPDGVLAISADRLQLLGFDLRALGIAPDAPLVRLADLKGVTYRYSEARQSVELEAADAALVPVVLDGRRTPTAIDPSQVQASMGVVLNYGAFVDVSGDAVRGSGQYDLRILLGGLGLLSSSGLSQWTSDGADAGAGNRGGELGHTRLDTSWRYIDVRRALAFTVGDSVADGGQMGAAYRFAGFQVRRDYSDRPDLVTMALPILTGSAAVPSTVDLYINGMRYFNGNVARGPFQFRSLPNIGGGATATVVLTDALGQETRIRKQIFFVAGLLPPGRLDFSVEFGFPREGYGIDSLDYDPRLVGSASARYGLNDWLTLLGHVEGMSGLVNGSIGGVVRFGGLGAVTSGVAVSRSGGKIGRHYSLDAQTRVAGVNIYGGIERLSHGYRDIVTAIADRSHSSLVNAGDGLLPPILSAYSSKTERAGLNFSMLKTGFSLSYTRLRVPNDDLRLASVSVNRTLFGRVSVWTNAYKDFGSGSGYGVFIGASLSFGRGFSASSALTRSNHSTTLNSRVSNNPGLAEGGLGWNLISNDTLSGDASSFRSADFRYQASFGTLGAGIEQLGSKVHVTGYMEGAAVAMGGGLFLSPPIDSSFAIVRDAGPNTPVLSNTRRVTRTDDEGRALVPYLNSLQFNTVSIDPTDLAIDLKPERTSIDVVPGDRSGVILDFGVAPQAAALVQVVSEDGQPLPIGSYVTLGSQAAVIGYDGKTYLVDLAAHNKIHVERATGPDCEAEFDFAPQPGEQVSIGPITCHDIP